MTTSQFKIIRKHAATAWNIAATYVSYLPYANKRELRELRRTIHHHRIASRKMLQLARGKHENP